jgi:hypothetical protein
MFLQCLAVQTHSHELPTSCRVSGHRYTFYPTLIYVRIYPDIRAAGHSTRAV